MIEGGGLPGCHRMAGFAIQREGSRLMIRIRRILIICQVTTRVCTATGLSRNLPWCVALLTTGGSMCSGKWESGIVLIMLKTAGSPSVSIMTVITAGGKGNQRVWRIFRGLIVTFMTTTRPACSHHDHGIPCCVAGDTCDFRMGTINQKACRFKIMCEGTG